MAIRQIVKIGDEVLKLRAKEVTNFDAKLAELLDDMKETMELANGVGIAAPQVGILKRACIVCVDGKTTYELINPVIIKSSGKQRNIEGCLSVPNRNCYVDRPKRMTVDAYNRNGELIRYKVTDYTAVAFSHEMDHLDGILFIEKMAEECEPPQTDKKKKK